MDYLADLPVKESCSILERATKNGGTASCRSAVFGCEEDGRVRNRDFEDNGEEDGTLRGWKRTEEESERTDTGL